MKRKTDSRPDKTPEQDGANMPLSGHLRELRNRILVVVIVLIAAMLVGLNYAREIVNVLLDLGRANQYQFVFIAPQEMVIQYFTISLVFAGLVGLPVIFYELYMFMSPGLSHLERICTVLALLFGVVFGCLGILFAYKILLPFMLHFMIGLSDGTGVQASISVASYISFLMSIFIIFAVIFEFPVVSVLLNQIGILKVEWMKAFRRYIIVLIFFAAAIVTPPDIVSQIMVAIPMLFLYEFSIILCSVLNKFRRKKQTETEEQQGN